MIRTKEIVFRRIRKLEKRFIPNLRNNKKYRKITFILLIPVALTTHYIDKLIAYYRRSKPTIKNNNHKINLSNIISGFTNLAFPNEEVEKIAIARADVCARCPFAVKTGLYSVVKDSRTVTIQGMKCTQCGCNLSAKVRSISDTCPVGKW